MHLPYASHLKATPYPRYMHVQLPSSLVSMDSNAPFSMMGTSTPNDSHEVMINSNEEGIQMIQPKRNNEGGGDQKKAKSSGQKETDQPISRKVKGIYGGLKGSLHSVGAIVKPVIGKFINVDEHGSEREESNAYKELMEQVEEEIVDRFPAKLWVVNGLLFILLIVFLTTSATISGIRHHGLLHMRMHSWAAFLLAVISGLPAVQLLTFIVSEPFVWIFKMKRYTVLFARMLKRSVDVTLWFTLVLWVWYTWFRPQVIKDTSGAKLLRVSPEEYKHTLNIVVKETTRLLMALTVAAFLWTVKRAAFFKLLVDLHFVILCDRIRQTILDFTAIRYIEKKSEHPDINGNEAGAEPIGDDGNHIIEKLDWVNVSYLRKETTPIWILKRLIDMYMDYYAKKRTHRPSKILQRLENTDDNEILMDEAKKMLQNLMRGHPHDSDIDRELLIQYGLDDKKIDHVFKLFASKKDAVTVQIITQEQFLRWAIKAIKNCKGLKRTIESSQNIFWKLELLLSLCVVVVSLVIWLLLSELITSAQIAILLTPFISASFVFSDSLKKTFDCLIFVFGMHPFDVGDRVIIDKVDLKVEELYILTTVFTRCDSGVEANYPNSELSTKSIINLEIEPEEFDSIEFVIPYDTPQELVCDLQIKIKKTLDDNITFTSDTTVAKKQITTGKKVTMSVYFKYLVTYHSAETRAQHRSKVLCKIIRMCKEMETEMRRLRNEMKLAIKRRNKDEDSMSLLGEEEEATDILRFQIDAKVKLSKIESLKKTVFRIIQDYDSRLKGCSQATFTGINKEKITMDVRMRHCPGLFKTDDDRNELKEKIENAINKDEKPDQRKGKRVELSWIPKTDWDDDC